MHRRAPDVEDTSIAYETVVGSDGSLPLLAPMSEVAGRLAPQAGAYHLMRHGGGRGVLMGGVPGVRPAKVVVIGAGVSGKNAIAVAYGMQADVTVLDLSIARLREIDELYHGQVKTITSNSLELEQAVLDADLVIGAVLVPGAKAPTLVSNSLVARMKPGSVLVDIAIDQAAASRIRTRPRTPIRRTRYTVRSSTALPTCPEPSPVRPPTHSPTRRFRTSRIGRQGVEGRGRDSSRPGVRSEHTRRPAPVRQCCSGAWVLGYHSLTQAALTQATKARDR